MGICVCVFWEERAVGWGWGVVPWMFEPEIFNLNPLGITLQVTSTFA